MDLGFQRRRRRSTAEKIVIGLAAIVAVGLPLGLTAKKYMMDRDVALNRARELAIDGPPCEQLTREQFAARGLKAPKGTIYEDARFFRQFGHMSCSALRHGAGWGTAVYPVCQFTSPKALKVVTNKGEWYFAMAPGQPATVATPHGEARCVLAANFTIKSLLGR